MGNCQAAEAATMLILRPDGVVERIYWSVSAREVMSSNPGHYVAMVVALPPARQLKLLRKDDVLRLGQVYRLVSFKEFEVKKCAKFRKLLKETQREASHSNSNSNTTEQRTDDLQTEQRTDDLQTEQRTGTSQSGSGNRSNIGGCQRAMETGFTEHCRGRGN